MIRTVVTPELMALLRRYRLLTARTGERWKEGDVIALDPGCRIEKYGNVIKGGSLPLALGAFSYSHSPFSLEMEIGRYCSISWGVQTITGDHPIGWATTSPITHYPKDIPSLAVYLRESGETGFRLHRYGIPPNPVVLGSDVWIGMEVLIKRGVKIGHGAIVGAGSVVTKDVPPYAIVGGAPARIIRYRFADPLIERLLRSEWWLYGPEKLQPLDMREPVPFLEGLEAAKEAGLQPLTLPVLTGSEIVTAGETPAA
jgi:acetyltransferase-like isoleucine patch superfamily enzyme